MRLWTYRGLRVRKFQRHFKLITFLFLLFPLLLVNVVYHVFRVDTAMDNPVLYGVIFFVLLVFSIVISWVLNTWLYQNSLLFSLFDNLRVVSNFLFENGYYYVKKGKNSQKTKEKIKYPRVYLKRDKFGLDATFILQGNKFQDKFLNLGAGLETMFDSDFMAKTFTKGFVTYTIILDHIEGRLQIKDVKVDDKGLRLMEDVWWNFEKEPHLLIGGGTGGGKTVLLMSILDALVKVGYVDIGDPKKLDLWGLRDIPIFRHRVFSTVEDMSDMLIENAELVEKRGQYMSTHENFTIGKNYAFYGLKPKFILFDEWASFISKLDGDYTREREVMKALTSLVLEGRQAGVFVILAMQRPDGEFIKTALRDNFMKRISVGHLEDTGYTMMFGDANRNKVFKKIDEINGKKVFGRGYVANNGEVAQEFFAPLVPFEDGFSFVDEFMKMEPLEEEDLKVTIADVVESQNEEVSEEIVADFEDDVEENVMAEVISTRVFAKDVDKSDGMVKKVVAQIEELGLRSFGRDESNYVVLSDEDQVVLRSLFENKETFNGTWLEMIKDYFGAE